MMETTGLMSERSEAPISRPSGATPLKRPLLERSFVHLPGIGPRLETHLWRNGVFDWQTLRDGIDSFFKDAKRDPILRGLDASIEALEEGNLSYFWQALPPREVWRILDGGFARAAYFDIEATGGSFPPLCHSTAVCFYFGGEVYQEYEDSRKRELLEFIRTEAGVLCSYNGAGYDLPFLKAEYGDVLTLMPHVDLCPWLRRLGLKGGLKSIQKTLTHLHQRVAPDLDGWAAVRLWRLHEHGVTGALETLLTYNAEDSVILEQLAVEAFNLEAEKRPELGLALLEQPTLPPLKTGINFEVCELLKSARFDYSSSR